MKSDELTDSLLKLGQRAEEALCIRVQGAMIDLHVSVDEYVSLTHATLDSVDGPGVPLGHLAQLHSLLLLRE